MSSIYLIGSLRNPDIPIIGDDLRNIGFDVFDNWHAAGPEADDYWQAYEKGRGHSYKEALQSYEAQHVFEFDRYHLNRCSLSLLVMPAGRSGHIELGYSIGLGKPGFILFNEEPERYDVMYNFAKDVFFNRETMLRELAAYV